MIVGEATAEKLILSDYIQPIYNPADLSQAPVAGFLDGKGKMLFCIPCKSAQEAVELCDRFQLICEQALAKALGTGLTSEEKLVSDFARLFYNKGFMDGGKMEAQTIAYYKGLQIQKNPMDLQVYHEIIWETKPDLIIECGTATGASAVWLADQLSMLYPDAFIRERGTPKVLTIDIGNSEGGLPKHPRVEYLTGSTLDEDVLRKVRRTAQQHERVMVILDDDHHAAHVRQELDIWPWLVSVGQYLILEDTNVNHPIMNGYGDGPAEALADWLPTTGGHVFKVDRTREKFFLTWNPGGYLRRVR